MVLSVMVLISQWYALFANDVRAFVTSAATDRFKRVPVSEIVGELTDQILEAVRLKIVEGQWVQSARGLGPHFKPFAFESSIGPRRSGCRQLSFPLSLSPRPQELLGVDLEGESDLGQAVEGHRLLAGEAAIEGGSSDAGEVGQVVEGGPTLLGEPTDVLAHQRPDLLGVHSGHARRGSCARSIGYDISVLSDTRSRQPVGARADAMTQGPLMRPLSFPSRVLLPMVAVSSSSCALFGVSSGSQTPVEAVDSPAAYREYLAGSPSAEDAARHRRRLAELELIVARSQLRPVINPEAIFSDRVGGSSQGALGQDTQLIFESEEGGWVGYQVVRIAPELKGAVRVFASEGEPVSLPIGRDQAGAYFSVEEPLSIPLVSTSSFDARVQQIAEYGGGMRFCFFSQASGSCEDGYEFSYDRAHFQKYKLARKVGGQATALCAYQMDPNTTQHSDTITVDMSSGRGKLRHPTVELHAHHGYLTVHFNGHPICQVRDTAFTEGFFTLADAPAISELSIELNAGSAPVYAPAEALMDVQAGTEPLPIREGDEAYSAFATDYNAYLAVLAGGEFPEAFSHPYFNLFLGKGEADAAYQAIQGSTKIDDYLAYLEAHPFNAHKTEIENTLFRLVREADTVEGYQKFLTQYPSSVGRLELEKRLADVQWRETVKKPSKKTLQKYLEFYPSGYHARRAELLLEGLDYAAANKAEVDEARKVIAQAQAAVDKSPVTAAWDVEVIDFQAGSLYFNLNNGPHHPRPSQTMMNEQMDAHTLTCELLQKRLPQVEFCVTLWSIDHFELGRPFTPAEATADALEQFYLSRLERGDAVDLARVIALLDRLVELKADLEYAQNQVMMKTYARLGMTHEAVYAFYRYALAVPKPSHVNSYAKTVADFAPALAREPDFQWVVGRFGGK